MRVVLVVLAAIGAALVGRSVAASCARRARTLRQAMDALQILRIQMLEPVSYTHLDVYKRQGPDTTARSS